MNSILQSSILKCNGKYLVMEGLHNYPFLTQSTHYKAVTYNVLIMKQYNLIITNNKLIPIPKHVSPHPNPIIPPFIAIIQNHLPGTCSCRRGRDRLGPSCWGSLL